MTNQAATRTNIDDQGTVVAHTGLSSAFGLYLYLKHVQKKGQLQRGRFHEMMSLADVIYS